jgi:hypothetical protein
MQELGALSMVLLRAIFLPKANATNLAKAWSSRPSEARAGLAQ